MPLGGAGAGGGHEPKGAGGAGAGQGGGAGAGQGGGAGAPACTPVEIRGDLTPSTRANVIVGYGSKNVFAKGSDVSLGELSWSLYGANFSLPPLGPGAVDLGAGIQTNVQTCSQCVTLGSAGEPAKTFYQAAGQLDVLSIDEPLTANVSASFKGLKLVEVTIDPESSVSTPVPGGGCLAFDDYSFTSTGEPPSAGSAQRPPTSLAAMAAWVGGRPFDAWSCLDQGPFEDGSRARVCSNDLLSTTALAEGAEWPAGIATTREGTDADGKQTFFATSLKTKAATADGANWFWYLQNGDAAVQVVSFGAESGGCNACHLASPTLPLARDFVFTQVLAAP